MRDIRYPKLALFAVAALLLCLWLPESAMPQDAPPASAEKFALLVGIDDYASPSDPSQRITPLKGPRNDVRLFGQLLETTYGFKRDAKHIVTLLGKQATHAAIIDAFRTHLIANAASYQNAVLVFYFSGHGSQAFDVSVGDQSVHDTLVAYDSRARTGRDILDNELVALFEQARQYTSEISFVLDSCHSGSAIKAAGTLHSRQLPPNPQQSGAAPLTVQTGEATAEDGRTLRSRRLQFALLSASQANESSYEDIIKTPDGTRYHGFFTFYLNQVLKSHPDSTVARATEDVARALARFAPYQHPQAVGNVEGRLFGGGGDRDDPYVRLEGAPKDGRFRIKAGAEQGLREGALLAVYAPSARKLIGDTLKLATASVTKIGDLTSDAVLSGTPSSPIAADAKVVIVTPFYGYEPLRLEIENAPEMRVIRREISRLLAPNALARIIEEASPYDFVIKRGCPSGGVYLPAKESEISKPADCSKMLYLTLAGVETSLLGTPLRASEEGTPSALASRVEQLAKQQNIRALDNVGSSLKDQVRVELETGTAKPGTTDFLPDGNPAIVTSGALKIGDRFRIKLNNKSDRDLYLAVLMLGTSGKIELITVNPHGDLVPAHTAAASYVPRQVGPPAGIETYKVFATASPSVDYRLLEQDGAKAVPSSPLEALIGRTTRAVSRDSIAIGSIDEDAWTTTQVDLLVEP